MRGDGSIRHGAPKSDNACCRRKDFPSIGCVIWESADGSEVLLAGRMTGEKTRWLRVRAINPKVQWYEKTKT